MKLTISYKDTTFTLENINLEKDTLKILKQKISEHPATSNLPEEKQLLYINVTTEDREKMSKAVSCAAAMIADKELRGESMLLKTLFQGAGAQPSILLRRRF
ncbi:unnamed protein product [Amoebophrya sp. A120]|nr:unnamed protein product [Amoebophrya sp. A120]|eukprot:GSA120T00012578001.1